MSFLSNQEEKNGCCVGSYRRELADTPNLLAALTKAAIKTQLHDKKLSALHTFKRQILWLGLVVDPFYSQD